jgi:sugar lactone lactonase YvrE
MKTFAHLPSFPFRAAATAAALFTANATGLLAIDPVFKPLYDALPRALAPATVIHREPVGAFLENLVVHPDGSLLVTSLHDKRVLRIRPDGTATTLATFPGIVTNLAAEDDQGSFIVAGFLDRAPDARRLLWRLRLDGSVEEVLTLVGAALPNGLDRLSPGAFLITDSIRGLIWRADVRTKSVSIWSDDAHLGGFDPASQPAIPAANGLRVHGRHVFVANMSGQKLLRLPVNADGSAGPAEVLHRDVFIDDFAIDAAGRIFATTHTHNSLIRLDPDRTLTVIATLAQGMQGATSAAFGRTPGLERTLYVTTTGGSYVPPAWGVEEAKVVRLELGR